MVVGENKLKPQWALDESVVDRHARYGETLHVGTREVFKFLGLFKSSWGPYFLVQHIVLPNLKVLCSTSGV